MNIEYDILDRPAAGDGERFPFFNKQQTDEIV